jgi:hypothetical protein
MFSRVEFIIPILLSSKHALKIKSSLIESHFARVRETENVYCYRKAPEPCPETTNLGSCASPRGRAALGVKCCRAQIHCHGFEHGEHLCRGHTALNLVEDVDSQND